MTGYELWVKFGKKPNFLIGSSGTDMSLIEFTETKCIYWGNVGGTPGNRETLNSTYYLLSKSNIPGNFSYEYSEISILNFAAFLNKTKRTDEVLTRALVFLIHKTYCS